MLLPKNASADDSGKCGTNVTYTYVEDTRTLTISGFGAMKDYSRDPINGKRPWNNYQSEIENIIIESGVTSIGDRSFWGFSSIKNVIIAESVTSIGYESFGRCSFDSINIPNSIKVIGESAFKNCDNLTYINIPDSIKILSNYSFESCYSLTSVKTGKNVEIIGNHAFYGCHKLATVYVSPNIKKICKEAFSNCNAITSVHIESVSAWCGIEFEYSSTSHSYKSNPLYYGANLYLNNEVVHDLIIPEGVESINRCAFINCKGIESVHIPKSMKRIGKWNSVGNVYISDLTSWCNIDFEGYFGGPNLYLNDHLISDLIIPNSVSSISNYAFWGFKCIKSLSIPNSVTTIGRGTFGSCTGLRYVEIPNNVLTIGKEIFAGCCNIKKINIGEGVTEISSSAFSDCWNLQEIIISDNIREIHDSAFYTHNSSAMHLKKVSIGKGIKHIGSKVFNCGIDDFYCYAENAPQIEDDTFWINGIRITILHVPQKSISDYRKQIWVNFKAIIEMKYKLNYFIDNVSYKIYELAEGEKITPEVAPTKEGYTFSGWSEIPETMPANDVTITGTFSINSYKLTYMIDDNVYKETIYEYGATITPEPQPDGDFQTFEWTGLPQTMPAHDVVVYANYTSGITEVLMASQQNVIIYAPNGTKLNKLQKGLNIMILDDGTIKKLIIK